MALTALRIEQDDLSGEATRALLALHLSGMLRASPPGQVFALDVSGLQQPNVTVWTAWDGHSIAGMGALKLLGGGIGEVKSMRTHPDHTRMGVGSALLERIVSEARTRGCYRLSLETGTGLSFDPALALYRKRGFVTGAEFGEYKKSDFSQFLHLDLPTYAGRPYAGRPGIHDVPAKGTPAMAAASTVSATKSSFSR